MALKIMICFFAKLFWASLVLSSLAWAWVLSLSLVNWKLLLGLLFLFLIRTSLNSLASSPVAGSVVATTLFPMINSGSSMWGVEGVMVRVGWGFGLAEGGRVDAALAAHVEGSAGVG